MLAVDTPKGKQCLREQQLVVDRMIASGAGSSFVAYNKAASADALFHKRSRDFVAEIKGRSCAWVNNKFYDVKTKTGEWIHRDRYLISHSKVVNLQTVANLLRMDALVVAYLRHSDMVVYWNVTKYQNNKHYIVRNLVTQDTINGGYKREDCALLPVSRMQFLS